MQTSNLAAPPRAAGTLTERVKAEEIRIVGVGDRDAWEAEHQQDGLPSQSWGYADALSASGIDPKLAVVRAGSARMLMPFFERESMGQRDIATTLGLSGASISPPSTEPLSLWEEHAAAQGWVAGYIQLGVGVELEGQSLRGELVRGNQVFVLDLRDDPFASASQTIRQKVRGAERMNPVLVEDRTELADGLKRLYPGTMERVGAGRHYGFSAPTLGRWALDPTSVVLGARIGDEIGAVSVFCVAGRHAEYHLNASTDAGRELTTWLIWNAVARLRDRGVASLNLGGGASPGDGVYAYKRRFNGAREDLRAVRQIYDRDEYDRLCRAAGVNPAGDWFPAYSAPAAHR
jgi:hypothetical protein